MNKKVKQLRKQLTKAMIYVEKANDSLSECWMALARVVEERLEWPKGYTPAPPPTGELATVNEFEKKRKKKSKKK